MLYADNWYKLFAISLLLIAIIVGCASKVRVSSKLDDNLLSTPEGIGLLLVSGIPVSETCELSVSPSLPARFFSSALFARMSVSASSSVSSNLVWPVISSSSPTQTFGVEELVGERSP